MENANSVHQLSWIYKNLVNRKYALSNCHQLGSKINYECAGLSFKCIQEFRITYCINLNYFKPKTKLQEVVIINQIYSGTITTESCQNKGMSRLKS